MYNDSVDVPFFKTKKCAPFYLRIPENIYIYLRGGSYLVYTYYYMVYNTKRRNGKIICVSQWKK